MRIRKNARELDRLEQESLKFHKDVYDGYCKLIEKFPERIKKVPKIIFLNNIVPRLKELKTFFN